MKIYRFITLMYPFMPAAKLSHSSTTVAESDRELQLEFKGCTLTSPKKLSNQSVQSMSNPNSICDSFSNPTKPSRNWKKWHDLKYLTLLFHHQVLRMPQAPTFLSLRLVIVREGKNSTLCCEVSHAWSLNQPPPTNTRFIRPSIQRGQLADWLANNLFPPALPAESEDSSKKKGGWSGPVP